MADLQCLDELREHGKMRWSENEDAWAAEPHDVVAALAREGFEEYKHEVTRSRRDRRPMGGVWQGLNNRTGIVASAIWVLRSADAAPIVFIDIDGELLRGDPRRVIEGRGPMADETYCKEEIYGADDDSRASKAVL